MRSFLAALAGIVAGGVAIAIFEFLGHLIFPLEIKIDPTNIEEIRTMMFKIPVVNLISVIVAHGLGLIVGLLVTRSIDKTNLGALFGVASFLFLMTLINLLMIPHPVWFMVSDLAIIVLLSFLIISSRKKA